MKTRAPQGFRPTDGTTEPQRPDATERVPPMALDRSETRGEFVAWARPSWRLRRNFRTAGGPRSVVAAEAGLMRCCAGLPRWRGAAGEPHGQQRLDGNGRTRRSAATDGSSRAHRARVPPTALTLCGSALSVRSRQPIRSTAADDFHAHWRATLRRGRGGRRPSQSRCRRWWPVPLCECDRTATTNGNGRTRRSASLQQP